MNTMQVKYWNLIIRFQCKMGLFNLPNFNPRKSRFNIDCSPILMFSPRFSTWGRWTGGSQSDFPQSGCPGTGPSHCPTILAKLTTHSETIRVSCNLHISNRCHFFRHAQRIYSFDLTNCCVHNFWLLQYFIKYFTDICVDHGRPRSSIPRKALFPQRPYRVCVTPPQNTPNILKPF